MVPPALRFDLLLLPVVRPERQRVISPAVDLDRAVFLQDPLMPLGAVGMSAAGVVRRPEFAHGRDLLLVRAVAGWVQIRLRYAEN